MKELWKRAATIFLSLAVLLSFTPFLGQWTDGAVGAKEVYAESTVTEIDIDFDLDEFEFNTSFTEPEVNALIHSTVDKVSGDCNSEGTYDDLRWWEEDGTWWSPIYESTDYLSVEKDYAIYIDTIKPNEGYVFPDSIKTYDVHTPFISGDLPDVTVKVNGVVRDDVELRLGDGKALMYAYVPIGKPSEEHVIRDIKLSSIPAPIVGEGPSVTGIMDNGADEGYEVFNALWVDPDAAIMSSGATFTAGQTYRIQLTLKADPGIRFPKHSERDVNLTVNGVSYDSESTMAPGTAQWWNDGDDAIVMELYFTALEKVSAPAGKTLAYTGKAQTGVAAGTGYTVSGTTSATKAGTYKATATPDAGYCWQDGTTDAKTISWKISPAKLTSAALSSSSLVYTGKARTQTTTVKATVNGAAKNLTKGTDYTVAYKNNTKVGTATVTIKGSGNYTGTLTKTFKINPKKAVISSTTPGTKQMKVTMSTKASATGGSTYQIKYRVKGASKWKTVTTTSKAKTIKNLKKGKVYQIKVRAYKKVNGKTYYGAWSKVATTKKVK